MPVFIGKGLDARWNAPCPARAALTETHWKAQERSDQTTVTKWSGATKTNGYAASSEVESPKRERATATASSRDERI
ncbi:hypothetical protein ASF91_13245 [Rhizobium sp. Leaf155]|nr:hypothetical protein ASF91_13245 [Rhizobium sp. Leaf155]